MNLIIRFLIFLVVWFPLMHLANLGIVHLWDPYPLSRFFISILLGLLFGIALLVTEQLDLTK